MAYSYIQEEENVYTFTSIGSQGHIRKVVTFEEFEEEPGVYNVLLESEIEGVRRGDTERTDNGDGWRVFSTVSNIMDEQLARHPERVLFVAGSDRQRNHIYRRGLPRSKTRLVLGSVKKNGGADDFEELVDGVEYEAFLVFSRLFATLEV